MERLVFLIFLCTAFERHATEHIFVSKNLTWLQAQDYCRRHYTDLSYIRNGGDHKLLVEAAGGNKTGWIGLERDVNNYTAWNWSGAGFSQYFNWGSNQPDDSNGAEDNVKLYNGRWFDDDGNKALNFYCFRINSPEMRMNWEDAWRYCRDNNRTKLFSMEHRLDREMALNVFKSESITDQVWIGLRYLGDRWFWMTNNIDTDRGWAPEDKDYMYPKEKRCGAFTRANKWVSWDCLDKLNFICA